MQDDLAKAIRESDFLNAKELQSKIDNLGKAKTSTNQNSRSFLGNLQNLNQNLLQQGLEIRCFWFQKKTVQLKTALREVYTYVLKGIFFQKTVYLQGFWPKSAYLKVTVR